MRFTTGFFITGFFTTGFAGAVGGKNIGTTVGLGVALGLGIALTTGFLGTCVIVFFAVELPLWASIMISLLLV